MIDSMTKREKSNNTKDSKFVENSTFITKKNKVKKVKSSKIINDNSRERLKSINIKEVKDQKERNTKTGSGRGRLGG